MRRLRVLSEHPFLGRPNDLRDEFEGAQAYIDAGLAEWAEVVRSVPVETTAEALPPETAVSRPSARAEASKPRRPR